MADNANTTCPHGVKGQPLAGWLENCAGCQADEADRLERRRELLAANGGKPLPSRFPVGGVTGFAEWAGLNAKTTAHHRKARERSRDEMLRRYGGS